MRWGRVPGDGNGDLRVADFEAAVKKTNEIYAKISGVRSRLMFQSLTGPQQFMLVRDYDKWADLDAGPVAKALAANAELARINLHMDALGEEAYRHGDETRGDHAAARSELVPLPSRPV